MLPVSDATAFRAWRCFHSVAKSAGLAGTSRGAWSLVPIVI